MKVCIIKIALIICSTLFSISLPAQDRVFRIVITPNDSVYKWVGDTPTGTYEFDIEKGFVIDFNNETHNILQMHSRCGRGHCGGGGVQVNYYLNNIMAMKGSYGYTTNVDSLKERGRDGFLDYVDKDGYWYYWNEQGFLTRKEKWIKGKLIETIHYKTTAVKVTKMK